MSSRASEGRLDQAVCLALYSATNATLQLYRDLLAPWGLSYQQLMVLGLLWEKGESTPGRIAETLTLDSSSVAGLLRRLQAAGFVEREIDPADRRRIRVTATAFSREIAQELGWLEDCLTQAVALDPSAAGELITKLHDLRDRIAGFQRPTRVPAEATA